MYISDQIEMNAIAILDQHLCQDVCGIIQDYLVSDNRAAMDSIIRAMNRRAVWRITDASKNKDIVWIMAMMSPWQGAQEVWPRVQAHVSILDQHHPFHLTFVDLGHVCYCIETNKYHANLTHPIGVFHAPEVERD